MANEYGNGALTPPEIKVPDVRHPKTAAGGVPAVWSSLKHAGRKMGLFRGVKTLLKVNKPGGFDCPGCAWPDPKHRALTEFCENGAKAVADESMKAGVDDAFFAAHSISELTGWSDHALNTAGRIAAPMIREPGATHYRAITWDEAFKVVGDALRALPDPNAALFYTSGRTSNEAAFMYQLMAREFGTNNMPDCSNMCHESSSVGLTEVIGIGKGTVTLEDFDHADTIFILGQNPGTNHPRMLTALQAAKRNGAVIVTINPLREAGLLRFKHPQELRGIVGSGTELTDLYLQVRINGDVAALQGIMKAMLEAEAADPGQVIDREFIETRTAGFEDFRAGIVARTWDELEQLSGLDKAAMVEAGAIAAKANRLIACWAMGLTQHKNGVANVQEVVNFLLLRGQIGRKGAGPCPVRGHSNVQGDRTVGITEKPSAAFLGALEKRFGFHPPSAHGLDTVHAIAAMDAGKASVFIGLGGNFLSATPDTEVTARAMSRCDLTVHISTKLNRSHLITGKTALILPCLGRTETDMQASGEQLVTVENSMGVVHASRGGNAPASPYLLSEPAIVAGIARAALPESALPWAEFVADYGLVRDAIEACIPGFDDYNARAVLPDGFELPNGPREGVFPTADGRAHFTVHTPPAHDLKPNEYLMMTIRTHDQYNTTVYGTDDRYRGIYGGRRVVLINSKDREEAGFAAGAKATLVSLFRGEERIAPDFLLVDYDIPRGSVATYFPEANVLVPLGHKADRSHTPASKSVVVTLRRSE